MTKPGEMPVASVILEDKIEVLKDKFELTDNFSQEIKVCVLASGSKGNAIYLSDNTTSILIDAGLSGIEIQRRMESVHLNPNDLSAVVVTHEHSDHIKGVGIMARRFNLPVYISDKTRSAALSRLGNIANLHNFECGTTFQINGFAIHPFSISHDAADPAGFTFNTGHCKIGIATDLGIGTELVKNHLRGSRLLVLEANHDPEMLQNGPYPWPLKQRIKGRRGHLSNNDSSDLLKEVLHDNLRHVILAHLSEENNTPEKAAGVIEPVLANSRAKLEIARQDQPSQLIKIPNI